MLKGIRDKIREQIYHRKEHSNLLRKLEAVDEQETGFITSSGFQKVLMDCQVMLEPDEWSGLLKKMQQLNGSIAYHSFLMYLAILPPEDYVDPALLVVRLPQPFRRILKVLERDILDAAWEKIKNTTAYKLKEAKCTDVSNGLELKEHEAKQRKCFPFCQVGEFGQVSQVVTTVCGNRMVLIANGNVLHYVNADKNNTIETFEPFTGECCVTNMVGGVYLNTDYRIAVIGGAEKMECKIYDVAPLKSENCFTLVAIITVPVSNQSTVSNALSGDGRLLSITFQDYSGYIYALPPIQNSDMPAETEAGVNSTSSLAKEATDIPRSTDPVIISDYLFKLENPCVVVEPVDDEETKVEPDKKDAAKAKAKTSTPPIVDDDIPSNVHQEDIIVQSDGDNNARVEFITVQENRAKPPCTLGFVLWRHGHNKLYKYYVTVNNTTNLYEIESIRNEWQLPSGISAVAMDVSTKTLITGLYNGNAIAWDTIRSVEICVLEQHSSKIVNIIVAQNQYVVTCADDKSIHFVDITRIKLWHLNPLRTLPKPTNMIRSIQNTEFQCTSVHCFHDVPLCFAHFDQGNSFLYDMRTGEILASLLPGRDNNVQQSTLQHYVTKVLGGKAYTLCYRKVDEQFKYRVSVYSVKDAIVAGCPRIGPFLSRNPGDSGTMLAKQLYIADELTDATDLTNQALRASSTQSSMPSTAKLMPQKPSMVSVSSRPLTRVDTSGTTSSANFGFLNSASGALLPSMNVLPTVSASYPYVLMHQQDALEQAKKFQQTKIFETRSARESSFPKRKSIIAAALEAM